MNLSLNQSDCSAVFRCACRGICIIVFMMLFAVFVRYHLHHTCTRNLFAYLVRLNAFWLVPWKTIGCLPTGAGHIVDPMPFSQGCNFNIVLPSHLG